MNIFSLLLFATLPNPALTPGEYHAADICHIKPIRHVSSATKIKVYNLYHIPIADRHNYVIDHLVPLELGGNNTLKNLWPQPKTDAHRKDIVENHCKTLICLGRANLLDVQKQFATNWEKLIE